MKKKFILLAMMLLTLMGGVKFNVLNAQIDLTKQYRLKVNEGGYAGKYLHVNSFYAPNNQPQVGIAAKAENTNQIFTLEDAGNGNYYLKCATNDYYIKCAVGSQWWCVYAYSTTEKTPLYFHYTDGTNFYLRDYDKMMGIGGTDAGLTTNNYFKVENDGVYCDASPNYNSGSTYNANTSYVTTWSLEEVVFSVVASADATEIWSDETVNLTAVAMDGAGSYTYSWSPATGLDDATSATPVFTPTAAGTYTFTCTATDANDAIATSEEISILVKDVKDKPKEIYIGSNEQNNVYLPLNTYNYASFSQQIYTADQIGQTNCLITEISFYRNSGIIHTPRSIDIYLLNTDKSSFTSNSDWVSLSDENKVYSSTYTNSDQGWFKFTLDTPFEYDGRNLLLCVHVKKNNNYSNNNNFAAFNTDDTRALYVTHDNHTYTPSGITQTGTRLNKLNYIMFNYEPISTDPTIEVNYTSLDFGTVRAGGDFWTEKETPSFNVNVKAKNTAIKTITGNDDFFKFSDVSGAVDQTEFNFTVSYNKEAEAGEKSGNIVVTYMNGEEEATVEIPMTATAYVPAQGDVVENPKAITFTEGAYTDNVTGVYDDYLLPNEENDGNNGDAVYTFTLTEESLISANVDGTNGLVAIYKAADLEGNGPSSENSFAGNENNVPEVSTAPTTFFNGFETGDFTGWQNIDGDGDGNVWEIAMGGYASSAYKAVSHSYTSTNLYPENYLITDQKYLITENSKLIVCATSQNSSYLDGYKVMVSETGEMGTFVEVEAITAGTVNDLVPYETDLSAYAGKEVYIAINHYTDAMWSLYIDNVELTDGSKSRSLAQTRSTSPQIENVYPAGEYVLVAAAEGDFALNITTGDIPAPEATTYVSPENNATEVADATLVFQLGKYTDEYQVLVGISADALDIVVDWTSELATTYTLADATNNTKYYWQVNTRNAKDVETIGEVYSFVTPLDAPQNVTASATELYPDNNTTTISWSALESATLTGYNVYVNDVKQNAELLTATSITLAELPYGLNPGNLVEVKAVHGDLGESPAASVYVKVAGTFPLTVNVKDSKGNTIEGATVTVITTSAYDEFYNDINDIEPIATDANGMAVFTLPLLGYNNGSSYYQIQVSMSPYKVANEYIYYYSISNNTPYSKNLTLYLPAPSSLYPENYEYILLAGDNLTLNWTAVEGVTGYNVYKRGAYNNSTWTYEYELLGTSTENTYTIVAEYDGEGSYYAVSAVFEGGLESDKISTSGRIYVLGTGDVKGLVTDTEGNPVAGAALELSGTNGFGEDIHILETETDGTFLVEDVIEGTYSLTVSHYNYEVATVSGISVNYNIEYDLGTIELTPKASIENVTVTAYNNGNVSWTGDYAKWNVYRRNTNAPQELTSVATELEATSTTDTEWETLEPGTYQYGVAALVEPQSQTRGTEVIFEEGFETGNQSTYPEGWTRSSTNSYNNWLITTASYNSGSKCALLDYQTSSSMTRNLTSPEITVGDVSPTLRFYYKNSAYSTGFTTLNVKVKGNDSEEWSTIWTMPKSNTDGFVLFEMPLEGKYVGDKIQIQFNAESCFYMNYVYIDDFAIVAESPAVETQIVWSNGVVKQGPATFIGGDTEKPTAWNVDANWSTGSVPADGAEVTINANAVITSEVNVASITINNGDSYPYNTLTVADKGILTVTGTISQQSDYLLVLEEGGQIFQNNNNVTARFRMSIDNPSDWSDETNKDGWQFISMPMTGVDFYGFASTWNSSTAQSTCDYDLYKYDGSQEKEWQNFRDGGFEEDTFKSGTGYLASRKEVSTVSLSGTLNVETPFAFSGLYQFSYNAEKPLANFHLVGNPFTYDIKWTDFTISGAYYDSDLDEVVYDKQYFVDGYAFVNKDGNYEYYSSADTDAEIKVGQGFFVQTLANGVPLSYSKSRGSAKSETYNSLNVIATSNAGKDNVVINLGGEKAGFNKLQNFNDAIATVYVAEDGKNYGIYNCDADVQEVELNFNANQMGNYTISIEPNGKFQTVTLVDRFTGIETNMLVEDYHFTAMSNVNNNRFIVKLAVSDQQSAVSDNFVYQSGEDLIIDAEGTVQIIDVMGRVLLSDEVESTNNRINVSGFRNGTYMVRVINGSEVKVEKVVIY